MNSPSALFAFLVLPGFGLAADQSLHTPEWLHPFPGAQGLTITASASSTQTSYVVTADTEAIVRHHEDELGKAGLTFEKSFDGIGTTIRASEGRTACVVRIHEQDEGVVVNATCALTDAVVFTPIIPPAPEPAPAPQPNSTPSVSASARRVQYRIDGSAKRVAVTYANESGATEQKVAVLPFERSFEAPVGASLYLSGQKIRVTRRDLIADEPNALEVVANGIDGTVHVTIRVDEKLFQEAATSVPHGVATARGVVPK
jgi:hypothetical protein